MSDYYPLPEKALPLFALARTSDPPTSHAAAAIEKWMEDPVAYRVRRRK